MQYLCFIPLSLTVSLVLQRLFQMINDGTLVNSVNKSSLPSRSAQTTLPLRSLREIIHKRIIQKKREIHPSHNKAYLQSLWTEIETLQCVSAHKYLRYCDNHHLPRVNSNIWPNYRVKLFHLCLLL